MFNALLEIVNSGVIDNPSSENDFNVIIKPMSQIDMNSFRLLKMITILISLYVSCNEDFFGFIKHFFRMHRMFCQKPSLFGKKS